MRIGPSEPAGGPLTFGGPGYRLDSLSISNASARLKRELLDALATPGSQPNRALAFTPEAGFEGWRANGTGEVLATAAGLRLTGAEAVLNPSLASEVEGLPLLSLALQSENAIKYGRALFVTDKGRGEVTFLLGQDTPGLAAMAGCKAWGGTLRALAVGPLPGQPSDFTLEGVWIGAKPMGPPFAYVRSLAPWRANLRAGRDETLVAIVRNPYGLLEDLSAELILPEGVTALEGTLRSVPLVQPASQARLEWKVRAEAPVKGTAEVVLTLEGHHPPGKTLALDFLPPLAGPPADYVPVPKPAKSDYLLLMHYCALWKDGTHYGWNRIENYPERRPAIGFYDEGTPEVADWHIKYAVEHGIQGFIYCWYRSDFEPEIHQSLGHAIHDGLKKARYKDLFKYTIMWENGCALGVKDRADMLDNLLPFWIENYFTDPSYLVLDGKPVLFVWQPQLLNGYFGGVEETREVLDAMRQQCQQAGFKGLTLIACVGGADANLQRRLQAEGWDATSAYGIASTWHDPEPDWDGALAWDYDTWLLGQADTWQAKQDVGALPDIVDVMMGWDSRPWHGESNTMYAGTPDPAAWKRALERAKAFVEAKPGDGLDKHIVVLDNWTEFGEGHYIEPTTGLGFSYVDAIREVFCDPASPPSENVIPEDVGLPVPETWYGAKRQAMLSAMEDKTFLLEDGLLAHWTFDSNDPRLAIDTSACKLHGFLRDCGKTDGISGKALACGKDIVELPNNALYTPSEGFTLSMWVKPSQPNQADTWFATCITAANCGWRFGLGGGKLAFQVPVTEWSHLLVSNYEVPVGEWTHVAATFDNITMRVFANGHLVGELERKGPMRAATNSLYLGGFGIGGIQNNFKGELDEVKLWVRALSAEELASEASPH